ncbi:MAG: transketolase [Nitrospirae bacterium]|nr:transketolase [Nitrospirota bacterium]
MNFEERCITTIRMLAVDMVQKADSGHPGLPMGAAAMAYVLWTRFLQHNPASPSWADRDRFVLSAGHGSALLYSLLHLTGYDLSLDELKRFRQWGSKTPGHPEYRVTPGVECTTGPLGQGIANAVGLAIAERHLAARFNKPEHEIVNHFTYILVGDGDLMEGIASEAASLAGHLRLGKLICLYDSNRITLSAETRLLFTENVNKRFDAYGWHVQIVQDGNDLSAVEQAITSARIESDRPSLITVKTHIGYGSPHKQDTFGAHGSPLGPDEVRDTKKNLDWPLEPDFFIPEDVQRYFRDAVRKGEEEEAAWDTLMRSYESIFPDLAKEWEMIMIHDFPEGWKRNIPVFEADKKGIATRAAGGQVMNSIAKDIHNLIGGSADLNPSTNTELTGKGNFQPAETGVEHIQGAVSGPWGYEGLNIAFGVREHAMGGIMNGIAYHGGLIPFGSTFLVFSDYMRPSIRLAALSQLHVIYVFTHDSVAVGEDGPTHQPVEHLASLRAIPGLTVLRPADASETAESWKFALDYRGGPVAIILSRQKLPIIDRKQYGQASGLEKGAYILADSEEHPDIVVMATGSEVHLALEARERLLGEGIRARVVSMPSWELFEEQSPEYRQAVLPEYVPKVSIEAGITQGWHKFIGNDGIAIGIDHFGASAPGDVLLKEIGFTTDEVVRKLMELTKRQRSA